MITVQWRVSYMEGTVMKEILLAVKGNTYSEVSPAYLAMLGSFGQVLGSELVECKEEKERLPQGLLVVDTK